MPSDGPAVQALAGDKAIADTTLNIPHPYEDGMAEAWIGSHAERFQKGEGVDYAVTLREDRSLIGAVGLSRDDRSNRAELGYWIARPFWKRGFATEAARAVVAYGFGVMALHRMTSHHMARNPASGRVMQKLGMQREGVCREHIRKGERYEDVVLYGILRREWNDREGGREAVRRMEA